MSDQQYGSPVGSLERVGHQALGRLPVEMSRRFVEHEHRRIGEQRPRDHETLALAAGELPSLLSDECVEALWKPFDPVVEARAVQHAVELVVRGARPREPEILADGRVEDVRLLSRERERAADVLLPEVAQIDAVDGDATRLRIEEAQKKVRDGRLPRSTRADEGDACAGIDPQVEPRERRLVGGRVARRDTLESDGHRGLRRRRRDGRIRHDRRGVRELEHSTPRRKRGRELARRRGERGDRVERREREQRERRDENTVERGLVVRRDGQREDADGRQTRNEGRQRVCDPGDEGITAAESHELAVGLADALERVLLPAVRDELGSAAQELDELGGQVPAGSGLPCTDPAREAGGEQGSRDAGERQPGCEHDRGRRQDECRRDDARDTDAEGDERRRKPAQVEPLERVDVGDHAAHEVTPTKCVELRRRERLDALVDRRTYPPECPERDVVRGQPLEVARKWTGEREEPDDDDDRRQREDRRLLGRARDEVARGRDQRDAEAHRENTERECEKCAAARELAPARVGG